MSQKKQSIYFLFALTLGLFLAVGVSVWATTIGTNISGSGSVSAATTLSAGTDFTVSSGARIGSATDGTHLTALADNSLLVVGQSEFDGITWYDGSLQASSTLLATGAATFYGDVTLGDATADTVTINASTISVANVATTTIAAANLNSFAIATSSASIPFVKFDTSTYRVGIGTTTPGTTLAVGGDGTGLIMGNGTSTLSIQSNTATRGGCIELEAANGSGVARIYVATAATSTVIVESGSCR